MNIVPIIEETNAKRWYLERMIDKAIDLQSHIWAYFTLERREPGNTVKGEIFKSVCHENETDEYNRDYKGDE